MTKVVIDYSKCQLSADCMSVCPVGVFEKQDDKMVVAHEDRCTDCKICEDSCPNGAVTVTDD